MPNCKQRLISLDLALNGVQGLAPHNSSLSMALAAPQVIAEMSLLAWILSQHQMWLVHINNLTNSSSKTQSVVNEASEASTGLSGPPLSKPGQHMGHSHTGSS